MLQNALKLHADAKCNTAQRAAFAGGVRDPEGVMVAAKVDEDRRKQIESDCVAEAWRTGATSAVTALGVAGAAVGGANYYFQGFRSSLGVSGKAALVVSHVRVPYVCACWGAVA